MSDKMELKLLERVRSYMEKLISSAFEVLLFTFIMLVKSIFFNREISLTFTNIVFMLSSIGMVLVFTSFSLWFKRKIRIMILIFWDLVLTVFMIADMVYFRYFNDVISVPVLRQAVLMDTLQSSISSLFRISDIFFVFDILLFIAVLIITAGKTNFSGPTLKQRVISASSVLLIGICFVSYGFFDINRTMGSKIFDNVLDRTFFVQNIGIINYHGFDIYATVLKSTLGDKGISEERKKEVLQAFKSMEKKQGTNLTGAAKGYNLIVVQAEAFQNMLIDMKVNGREVTPNLNRFIKKSAYFKNYFSQTAQGSTSDAEFLSNASYYPLTEGSVYFRYPNNTFDTLPKAMKGLGYKTYAMHAYKGSYWNRSFVYPVIGFDHFYNMPDYKFNESVGWGLGDKSFFKQSVDKLKKIDSPFHAFLISLSAHHPYDAFNDISNFDVAPYEHTFLGNYLKAQHYADEALGELFMELENSGLMGNSVIVIYGDHAGIQKEKTEEYKEFLNLNDNAELRLIQMSKVPLIIHFPGDKAAGVRETAGGQIDLYPTLANLYGIKPAYALGKDLFNSDIGYAVFRNGNITDGTTAYIKSANLCFDIVSGQERDLNTLSEKIEFAEKQLEVSDDIISGNLISYFLKDKSK
ncbi:MAG: LTA synthase family protein [Clostridia bacterium]|nr:LTA synthase family protein [Clostridia bacterium]